MTVDTLITDVSDRPIETSPKGERYVVVSFREAEGKVIGTPEGVEVWEAMTPAEREIAALRDAAVALGKRAAAAEFAVDYDRHAAGLKFIELQALVKAEGHTWEDWYAKNVNGVDIRTAYRYMALARAPAPATADQPSEPTDTMSGPAEAKETVKKALEGSPRRRLAAIVSKLSKSEAEEVLALVTKSKARR